MLLTKDEHVQREEFRRLVARIDRDADTIIVEGAADRRVLQALGAETSIAACGGRDAAPFCRAVAADADHVVILTDFDEAGKELNQRLRRQLSGDVDVIASYRQQFGQLLAVDNRQCVEDIAPLLRSPFDTVVETRRRRPDG